MSRPFNVGDQLSGGGDRPSSGFLVLMGAIGCGPTLAGSVVGR